MKRKLRALFTIFIFLSIGTTSITVNSIETITLKVHNYGETIYVDDNNTIGPWDGTKEHPFRYIQDGINVSEDNDTVFVCNGIYYENIAINKSINLLGEEETILDGMNSDILIDVISKDVAIQNFTIRNSGGYVNDAGVKLGSNNNVIKNCVIYRTKTGIYANNSAFNKINNCTFHTNGVGIFLETSDNNIVEGCCFSHNSIGIHLESSCSNLIKYSYLHTNGISCFFTDSSEIKIFYCNISDNSVNIGGIFIIGCSNILVNNCIIRHTGTGISISSSNMISITDCTLHLNTHFAISMRIASRDIIVSQCEIRDNLRFGIYIKEDNFCTITNNNILNNALAGLHSERSVCDARNNWWGSPFGPSYTYLRSSSINRILGQMQIFPWLLKPLQNIGAHWKDNEPYMNDETSGNTEKQINLPGTDTDGDDVPDWWEKKWGYNPDVWDDHGNLDPDNDALNNFEECYTDQYDSNPFHKDIFLEIDWMESPNPNKSNKPSTELMERIIAFFDEHEITLHVDLGDLDGGEEIPITCCSFHFSFDKLQNLYWNYFLHNDLNNPRKGIFHYGIICNYCPDLNFPFFGWDQFDSFAISAQELEEKNPLFSRGRLIAGGVVHHLGHTLGLLADTHGGIDNLNAANPFSLQCWKYRNYKSCMNYHYKYKLLTFSDGDHGKGDFDDWSNFDFSFFKDSHFEWPKT